jgi:hypothetical protein
VVETRVVPFITTGILHETSSTVGQIGTGIANAPVTLFDQALVALAKEWDIKTQIPYPAKTVQIELEKMELS